MNIGVHVCFSIMVSSGYMPSSGTTGSYGSFIPSFLRNLHTALHSGYISFHSHQQSKMFRENSIETNILSRVKEITSPGWMHETSVQGWCTGMTQRDGMGNTCKSMADSCQCKAKPLQYCKIISLQLIKINGKKKQCIEP